VQQTTAANNMNSLITNNFMNTFVKDQGQTERVNFLNKKFKSRQPIFKNFIENNTCINRRDVAKDRLEKMYDEETTQHILVNQRSTSIHGSNHSFKLQQIKPMNTVNRLLRLTAQ
jgi:hypothetical protein